MPLDPNADSNYHFGNERNEGMLYSLDGSFGSRSTSITEQLIPFRCLANIIGLDGSSQQLSISLLLKVETLGSENCGDEYNRSRCRVTAQQFEGRIASLGDTNQTAIRLQEIHLLMRPSMEGFEGPGDQMTINRSIDALSQNPTRGEAVVKEASQGRDRTFGARIGYPLGMSVDGNIRQSNWITSPAESVGLDYKVLAIDCVNLNNFLWRYGIASTTDFLHEPLLNRAATFINHTGDFSFASNMLPCSMRIEVTLVCRLPTLSLPGRLLSGSFIRYKQANYPCRDIRIKLEVDILPTEMGSFWFPRNGISGKRLDLGSYRFVREDGHLCLDISREKYRQKIVRPHLRDRHHRWRDQNWSIKGKEPGELEVREIHPNREVSSAAGELHLEVTDLRK